MGFLAQRGDLDPLTRQLQGLYPVAGRLMLGHGLSQRGNTGLGPAFTLLLCPKGQFVAGGVVDRGQEGVGFMQIVADAGRQRQHGAPCHQIDTRKSSQPEQPLAQGIPSGLIGAVGPQQAAQAVAGRGSFQRQPGQQPGVRG
jgi:hypothetical protein